MKAALNAWVADSNLLHPGAAKQSEDPDVVAATVAKPWRRAEVSCRFEWAQGTRRTASRRRQRSEESRAQGTEPQASKTCEEDADKAADRKAALAFEREQARRERERAKGRLNENSANDGRRPIDQAQAALDTARRKHYENAADTLEKWSPTEEARWEKELSKLEALLQRARG